MSSNQTSPPPFVILRFTLLTSSHPGNNQQCATNLLIDKPYTAFSSVKFLRFLINVPCAAIFKVPFSPARLIALIAVLIMATQMPAFLQRLFRPFTTSTRLSINPEAPAQIPAGSQKCTVAAGCFWGVEHLFRKNFEGKGLIDAKVGYIGGDTDNPGYRAVCSGRTGRELSLPICVSGQIY